jgi:hypothetical protein
MEPSKVKASLGQRWSAARPTMPGDKEPESRTADECVKLLLLVS